MPSTIHLPPGQIGELQVGKVFGEADTANMVGVLGITTFGGVAVVGKSTTSHGVGVQGIGGNDQGGIGMLGDGDSGVVGRSPNIQGTGILATTDRLVGEQAGVYGESKDQGVFGNGTGPNGTGVYGTGAFGVRGESKDGPAAIQGKSFGAALAGKFIGDVEVTGDIRLIQQDLAEDFDVLTADDAEPGTVMVLNETGRLIPCHNPYDTLVVGVVAGAGTFKPAIVLGRQPTDTPRHPVALVGKVYCKADARFAPIKPGDLLTTSPTPGHAMKVTERENAFGAVIGKALEALPDGLGLIPMVIALQ